MYLDVNEDRCADTNDKKQCFETVSGEGTGKTGQRIPVWGFHLNLSHHSARRQPNIVVGK